MTILFVSMYGIHGAVAPVIDKATDPVMFTVLGIDYYAKGLRVCVPVLSQGVPADVRAVHHLPVHGHDGSWRYHVQGGHPHKAMFTFIDSFQVITLLSKDMEQIRDAQRARGLNTEGNLLQRFKAFIPIMVPVVANSIVKVQDQAVAMETKGFNSECKKPYTAS